MFCPKCGREQQGNATFCSSCGTKMTENVFTSSSSSEDAGIGLKVLSLLIPLAGGIMYLMWHKDFPVKAKTCGIYALVGFVLNLIIYAMM